jgi:hypothetical protein
LFFVTESSKHNLGPKASPRGFANHFRSSTTFVGETSESARITARMKYEILTVWSSLRSSPTPRAFTHGVEVNQVRDLLMDIFSTVSIILRTRGIRCRPAHLPGTCFVCCGWVARWLLADQPAQKIEAHAAKRRSPNPSDMNSNTDMHAKSKNLIIFKLK